MWQGVCKCKTEILKFNIKAPFGIGKVFFKSKTRNLDQCFSNCSMRWNHLEDLLRKSAGSPPRFPDSVSVWQPQSFAFLTRRDAVATGTGSPELD